MDESIHWTAPPDRLQLGDRAVHVWRASLDLPAERIRELRRSLEPGEIERADRFIFDLDRIRFIAARGILRQLLSKYRDCPETEIRIQANVFGKPFVDGEICFNLSHSFSLGVFAFARNLQLGVDLERIRSDVEYLDIARRYFTKEELQHLEATPKERQIEVFFRCWTRKEAFVKARGRGLTESPTRDEFRLTGGGEESWLDSDRIRWGTRAFVPQEGFAGAIVCSVGSPRFFWWEYSP